MGLCEWIMGGDLLLPLPEPEEKNLWLGGKKKFAHGKNTWLCSWFS